MKNSFLYTLIFIFNLNCIPNKTVNTVPKNYNIANHDIKIPVYKDLDSYETIGFIEPNLNFRVSKKVYSKTRRRVYFNNQIGYVVFLFFKNEKEFSEWVISGFSNKVEQNSNYVNSQPSFRTIYTGPRGGRYYINSSGNKVYIKR